MNQQSCKTMTRNTRERESQQQYQQETPRLKPPPSYLKQPPPIQDSSLQVQVSIQHDDDLLEIYNRAMQDLDAADNDDNVMEVYMNAMSNLKSQQEQHGETLPRSVMDIKRPSSSMSRNTCSNWDVYALEEFERDYEASERDSSIYQEEQPQVRKDAYRYDSHHDAEYRSREPIEQPWICDSYYDDSDLRSYESNEQPPASRSDDRMERVPGLSARGFQGHQERWEDARRRALFVNPCNCCGQLLHYIDDADYFLCPVCDVGDPSARHLF